MYLFPKYFNTCFTCVKIIVLPAIELYSVVCLLKVKARLLISDPDLGLSIRSLSVKLVLMYSQTFLGCVYPLYKTVCLCDGPVSVPGPLRLFSGAEDMASAVSSRCYQPLESCFCPDGPL